MTKTGEQITEVVIGDDFRVERTYTSLPTGITINKAWLTIKTSDRLADAQALFPPKVITGTLSAAGHITDDNTTNGDLAMYFDLFKTETILATANLEYVYDIQVRRTTGEIHTLEKGTIAFIRGVTDAIV